MSAVAAGGSPGSETATPIKHVVVIFGENISFDHYFGTYPTAANFPGEPKFKAKSGTPAVNGYTDALLLNNPNALNVTGNGAGAVNPFRLDRTQAATADQDHNYTPEQEALHFGLMDAFPEYTGTAGPPPPGSTNKGLVMGYYDGNTVTALWNYAQHYAMDDNSFDTNFGPSTPGAINLVSGQTNGVTDYTSGASADVVEDGGTGYTLVGDADPIGDMCSTSSAQVQFTGNNIGVMLNNAGISWGFFTGGFDLTQTNVPTGTTGCFRSTVSTVTGTNKEDYIPHHEPFQYYTSTANPTHARPTSVDMIGQQGDAGNHQYDIDDFYAVVKAGHMPTVSFLKAPGFQDAHAGYSDPLDEQTFVTTVVNFLQTTKEWESMAIIINYDDSDGWYDHQMPPIVNQSATSADALSGPGACGTGTGALPGASGVTHAQGRCGYGPRLPYIVISPYAKTNYVSHVTTDQSSTIRFIEDNWLNSERVGDGSFDAIAGAINDMFDFSHAQAGKLKLNTSTGEPE
jgi:phospholipase C